MNFENKRNLILLLLSLIFGILDYYMCDFVVYVLKVPLFCDTIFCLALTFFANPLWGILAVIFYHLFDILVSHSFVVYQLYTLSAFLCCLTAWLYKKFVMKSDDTVILTIVKLLGLSVIMCLVMSISGGIISRICAYLNGNGSEYTFQTQFLAVLFEGRLKFPLLDAILLRLPVNIADRLITIFAGFGVYKLMQKKVKIS
ncbi:MAG: ECF transporter S component [Treponema sp.]|nr:ECF transporter S component [Candidatus Treponema equifaecale]